MVRDKAAAAARAFEDIRIHVRWKLCALWISVMFFYIYGDYFELYQPGKLKGMLGGQMALHGISQGMLLAMAGVMVVPGLMIFLSLVLPPRVNRWTNIVFGAVYTLIMLLAIRGGWYFYILYGVIEMILTMLIVWYAWTWPKQMTR